MSVFQLTAVMLRSNGGYMEVRLASGGCHGVLCSCWGPGMPSTPRWLVLHSMLMFVFILTAPSVYVKPTT